MTSRVSAAAAGEFLREKQPPDQTLGEARALIDPGVRTRRDLHATTILAFSFLSLCSKRIIPPCRVPLSGRQARLRSSDLSGYTNSTSQGGTKNASRTIVNVILSLCQIHSDQPRYDLRNRPPVFDCL